MGRKRTINRDELMQAVETVARRDGIGGLSIDAVAKEAGVSKSSVVYDCESKAGLLAAFTRQKLAKHQESFEAKHVLFEGQPNGYLRALIEEFRTAPTDEDVATALLISVGMGANAECRQIMREQMSFDAERVREEAAEPHRMLRTLLTLHGMAFLEYYDLHRFDQKTRNEILDELMAIAESDKGANQPQD
ncbi:TetR family transcriptional regulator [Paracoccus sp. MBLB3053]|uniref:TetR family transcriptional regulator n=1 Tax=Paracoccus aurantius TaxID=3073814 RepID=A0ABU2HVH0_9RHOB|nr:TetR family transcriptional regulator [Paracoccus sp. MBLB3053]MDS9469046.1 TetR family transcriptional regulator [Paracoccus sp. MBLB3053]